MGAGVGLGAGAPVAADALVSDSAHDDHDHDAEHPFGEVCSWINTKQGRSGLTLIASGCCAPSHRNH